MQYFFINKQKRSYISVKHDSCIILLVYRRHEYKIAIQQDIRNIFSQWGILFDKYISFCTYKYCYSDYIVINSHYSDTKIVRVFYSSHANNG